MKMIYEDGRRKPFPNLTEKECDEILEKERKRVQTILLSKNISSICQVFPDKNLRALK